MQPQMLTAQDLARSYAEGVQQAVNNFQQTETDVAVLQQDVKRLDDYTGFLLRALNTITELQLHGQKGYQGLLEVVQSHSINSHDSLKMALLPIQAKLSSMQKQLDQQAPKPSKGMLATICDWALAPARHLYSWLVPDVVV